MRGRGNKYGARKTLCREGHVHDSAREARRCNDLTLLERAGEIMHLRQQPRFDFNIGGQPVKMKNGHTAHLTADFAYVEVKSGKDIVEDSKGFVVRDYPLRAAIFRALFPMIELREV
jgi:hypothetical protein